MRGASWSELSSEGFGFGLLSLLIFLIASHLLTFSIHMDTVTNIGTYTLVLGVVGLVVPSIERTHAQFPKCSITIYLNTHLSTLLAD